MINHKLIKALLLSYGIWFLFWLFSVQLVSLIPGFSIVEEWFVVGPPLVLLGGICLFTCKYLGFPGLMSILGFVLSYLILLSFMKIFKRTEISLKKMIILGVIAIPIIVV